MLLGSYPDIIIIFNFHCPWPSQFLCTNCFTIVPQLFYQTIFHLIPFVTYSCATSCNQSVVFPSVLKEPLLRSQFTAVGLQKWSVFSFYYLSHRAELACPPVREFCFPFFVIWCNQVMGLSCLVLLHWLAPLMLLSLQKLRPNMQDKQSTKQRIP